MTKVYQLDDLSHFSIGLVNFVFIPFISIFATLTPIRRGSSGG
jgi:hypothetical protein